MKVAVRYQKRHVQARRRLTTSSSRSRVSSVPKRLGQGMSRRMTRSTSPRKPITTPKVAAIEAPTPRCVLCRNQKYAAGLVRTAMKVATRASRRSCEARTTDSSLERNSVLPVGSAAVAIPAPQCSHGSAYPLYAEVNSLDFSHSEVERAARYHRPRYAALFVDLLLSVAVLAVLQWLW